MKTISALCLLACATAAFTAAPSGYSNNGKIIELKEEFRASWYTCTKQGNYPHPHMCDHYIACTTNLDAYEMPCAMGHGGKRLWYVRDSGPVEQESYCDYPENVDCDLDQVTDAPATDAPATDAPATDAPATDAPVTEGPPATEGPIDPTDCPKNGTTRRVGDECEIDCDQCSWCVLENDRPVSYYWRCQRDSEPDSPFADWKGTWALERCGDGTLVDKRVSLARSLEGGLCTHWDDLHKDTQDDYKNPLVHPECQREEPCEYGQNEGDDCSGNYWYRKEGSDTKEDKKCEGDLKWSQEHENCKPCDEVASCAGKC